MREKIERDVDWVVEQGSFEEQVDCRDAQGMKEASNGSQGWAWGKMQDCTSDAKVEHRCAEGKAKGTGRG